MTNRDCGILAFKVLGLWLMVTPAISLAGLPVFWEPDFERVRRLSVLAAILPAIVSFGVGYAVWFAAGWLSNHVFAEVSPPLQPERLRAQPLFALALSVIGALFLAESLPAIVNSIGLFYQSRVVGGFLGPSDEQQRLIWTAAAKADAAAGVASAVVGSLLLVGPARLGHALSRLRKDLAGTLDDDATKPEGA